MKFFDKLKEKLGKRDFRNGLIKIGAVVTIATAAVTFAACNKTGQTPTPTPTPTPGPDTSYTASQILEENTAYNNLNLTNAVFDELQQNVAKQFNVEKDKVEIVDMHFDKQNANKATVVAKIGGEKVVTASYQNKKIAELRGANKKDLVLEEAGYTADQKVEKDQRSTVDAKFTQAVQTILDEIKQIENITPERVNEIFAGISNIKLPDSLKNNYDFAVASGVREDRTVVVFTGKNGKFEDHVLSVDGKENMTNEEILAAIKSGKGFSQTTRTIDPSKKYEAPALEEKPVVETITIGEIFDQNFAKINFSADVESAFQNIYTDNFANRQTSTLFYTQEGKKVSVYVNVNSNGRDTMYKLSFETDLDLKELNNNVKVNILNSLGLNANDKIEKSKSDEVITNIESEINSQKESIKSISNANVERDSIFTNATKDNVDKEAFGAKLCPDKEIVATYVGAMGSRQLNNKFGTGYVSGFNMAVVYRENDQIVIEKAEIIVPYYTTSTNESLYNTFLNDSDGTKHSIVSNSTEVVNNPVIATENGKKAEYNISFESDDPQLASIASSAISQWLKNEEDSLSR